MTSITPNRCITTSCDAPENTLGKVKCMNRGSNILYACKVDTRKPACMWDEKRAGNTRTLWMARNPLITAVFIHRKEELWYQKPQRHLLILVLEKILPRGHTSILQGLPAQPRSRSLSHETADVNQAAGTPAQQLPVTSATLPTPALLCMWTSPGSVQTRLWAQQCWCQKLCCWC